MKEIFSMSLNSKEILQLSHNVDRLNRRLSDHDSLTRCETDISRFLRCEGKEININIKADTCSSEIIVSIGDNNYSSHEFRMARLHDLIRTAILKEMSVK